MKYTNMAIIYSFPAAVKVYMSSFPCQDFDVGDGQKPATYMAADLSVDCSGDEPRGTIIAIAAVALAITIPLVVGVMALFLRPIRDVLESRTEKECSPLIDFAVSRWKPKMWYFSCVDIVRRIVCTSGLLILHGRPQSQLLLAILLNIGFMALFREATPFWDHEVPCTCDVS